MSSSDVSAVVNHFPSPNEGFTTTTSGPVTSGATTVGLTSASGLTNGNIFVGIIEPGGVKQQVFTGTVDVSGVQITGVVWTRGTNVDHAAGVTIVDYVSGTGLKMVTKGLLVEHAQAGTHAAALITSRTADTTPASGDSILTYDLSATALKKVTLSNLFANAPSGTTPSTTLTNPYKFRVTAGANSAISNNTWTTITFNAEQYDTGSNMSTTTFVAPVNGFYQFNINAVTTSAAGNLQGFGVRLLKNGATSLLDSYDFDNNVSYDLMKASYSDCIQLTAADTIVFQAILQLAGGSVSVGAAAASGYLVSAT